MATMTTDVQAKINVLDMAFQKLSGFQFKMRGVITGREQAWAAYLNAGFTLDDLDTVLVWINRRIKEGKRDIGAKRFSTLIGNLDRFDEELGMAKAQQRNTRPAPTARDRVVAQFRPVVAEQTPQTGARPAHDIALEALRAWKKQEFGTEK